MKKSVSVSLLVMGTAALSGCGEKVDTAVYTNADTCTSAGIYGREKCRSDFEAAKREHELNAPIFAAEADCQQQFGLNGCQPSNDKHAAGSGHYVPLMSGYLIGRFTQQSALWPQPLYQMDGHSAYRNAAGVLVAEKPGRFTLWSTSRAFEKPEANRMTLKRGGFGQRAKHIGS